MEGRKRIAHWVIWGNGYMVCSPGSMRYDFWFGSLEEMREFAQEEGWRLKRA